MLNDETQTHLCRNREREQHRSVPATSVCLQSSGAEIHWGEGSHVVWVACMHTIVPYSVFVFVLGMEKLDTTHDTNVDTHCRTSWPSSKIRRVTTIHIHDLIPMVCEKSCVTQTYFARQGSAEVEQTLGRASSNLALKRCARRRYAYKAQECVRQRTHPYVVIKGKVKIKLMLDDEEIAQSHVRER